MKTTGRASIYFRGTERLLIVVAAMLLSVLGYKLFQNGITYGAGEVSFQWGGGSWRFVGSCAGLMFMFCNPVILIMLILKGRAEVTTEDSSGPRGRKRALPSPKKGASVVSSSQSPVRKSQQKQTLDELQVFSEGTLAVPGVNIGDLGPSGNRSARLAIDIDADGDLDLFVPQGSFNEPFWTVAEDSAKSRDALSNALNRVLETYKKEHSYCYPVLAQDVDGDGGRMMIAGKGHETVQRRLHNRQSAAGSSRLPAFITWYRVQLLRAGAGYGGQLARIFTHESICSSKSSLQTSYWYSCYEVCVRSFRSRLTMMRGCLSHLSGERQENRSR